MIPPCDPIILESNPQFKKLYQQLTTTLLNADGSTRANDAQPARQAVLEDLKNCRVRHAKRQIAKQTLRRLAFDEESGLADEYRDTVAVIALYLDTPRSGSGSVGAGQVNPETDNNGISNDEALSLLTPDIDAFYANVPVYITPLSNVLASAVDSLRTIADPDASTEPKGTSKGPSRVSSQIRTRQTTARSSPSQTTLSPRLTERLHRLRHVQLSELPAARRQMAVVTAEVLAVRAQILERTVVLLERAKHGALARATKAKAEHLATVAEGIEGKLNVMKLDISSTIYNPETTSALSRYQQHLHATRERLEEQRVLALEELNNYNTTSKGSSGPLVDIARRYGGLIREMEDVSMEISRLEQ